MPPNCERSPERTVMLRAHREVVLADAISDALDEHGYSVQVRYHRTGGREPESRASRSGLITLARVLLAAGLIDDSKIGEHW